MDGKERPFEADGGALFDLEQIGNYTTFLFHSVRRHRLLAAALFLVTIGLTAAVAVVWPRTYRVEAKLLARRNDLMTSLSNPSRPARPEADDPTRAASELIHQRENLLSIIQETDLVNESERIKPRLSRLAGVVRRRLLHDTASDPVKALIGTLEQRLTVTVEKEGIITIAIEWSDPRLASELVQAAVQNFIDTRHDTEAAAITEAISILQGSAASLQADVDKTIAQLRDDQAKHPLSPPQGGRNLSRAAGSLFAKSVRSPEVVSTPVIAAPSPTTLAELGRLNAALDTKRLEIKAIEGRQRQQLAELQTRLATALTVYTDGHPTVAALRQNIASASEEAPELSALRNQAAALEAQCEGLEKTARLEAARAEADHNSTASPSLTGESATPTTNRVPDRDGPLLTIMPTDISRLTDIANPTSRLLTLQLAQLANLLDRINGARLELATSGAGLKYRYSVTRPPEVPTAPVKPRLAAVLLAGILGAIAISLAMPFTIDLVSGALLEPWQIVRQTGVPVLIGLSDSTVETELPCLRSYHSSTRKILA